MPTHKHDIYTGNGRVSGGTSSGVWQGETQGMTPQTEPTGGSESHTHTQEGETGDASNLPPYYTLAMIMRALAENRYEVDSASWSSSLLEGTPQRGSVHATQLGLHDLRRRGEV